MNPLDNRRQALNWLFAATRPWLFQGRRAVLQFPHGNDVDWKAVGDLAYFHNVEPLLYWMASNTQCSVEIPEGLKQRWEQAYFGNFLRNEEYFDILKTLLGRCEKEGISIILLKGPALIGRIYRDPALRIMSDLDILCFMKDLRKLVDIAREMGFTTAPPGVDIVFTHHVAMYNAEARSLLEFHFMPYGGMKNPQLFMKLAWDQREWIEVSEIHCPVLSLEMEVVFDLAHIIEHQFDIPLKHYLDIAGLLIFCRDRLNRDEIHSLLRGAGLQRGFFLILSSLSSLLNYPLQTSLQWLDHRGGDQEKFDASLQVLLALPGTTKVMDIRGTARNFLFRPGAILETGWLRFFLKNGLHQFLDALALQQGIQSRADLFRFCLRRLIFYFHRFVQRLIHLPETRRSNKKHSLAKQRAGAKTRLTAQLLRIARPRQLGQ
ncbi:MAG: nucleotidyltransferase family protein [Deltaproteobacteria bacterium]|nr:nucleotidyltransferase family protein [Deltaproteobacteria bacterium]